MLHRYELVKVNDCTTRGVVARKLCAGVLCQGGQQIFLVVEVEIGVSFRSLWATMVEMGLPAVVPQTTAELTNAIELNNR